MLGARVVSDWPAGRAGEPDALRRGDLLFVRPTSDPDLFVWHPRGGGGARKIHRSAIALEDSEGRPAGARPGKIPFKVLHDFGGASRRGGGAGLLTVRRGDVVWSSDEAFRTADSDFFACYNGKGQQGLVPRRYAEPLPVGL
jgi:hypothetical protein